LKTLLKNLNILQNLKRKSKKMKIIKVFLSLLILLTGQMIGQQYKKTENGIKANLKSVDVEVEFYSPAIVRLIKTPTDHSENKISLSVIKTPGKTDLNITDSDNIVTLSSKLLNVMLNLQTGKITYSDSKGNILLNEKDNGTQFTPMMDVNEKSFKVRQAFLLDKTEAIYGLGQQQKGKMIQRNQELYMLQNNTEDFVPFFQSVKGYGVYWDNYSPTTFIDNGEETSFNSEVGGCIDYYVMFGGTADGVITQMRDLTGQVPMFPLWTYGFWQSKERYKSQNETIDVVKKYRDLGVPLDGIIQDWQYWGDNFHWNAMEFLNPQFPNPQKMISDIHGLNAHIIISVWASFGPKTNQYKILNEKNMLLNFRTWPLSSTDTWPPDPKYPSGVRVYDAFNPEARDIYWDYLNKGVFSLGMDGWWLDSSEPDHLESKPSDFDDKTFLGSYRKVCNAFPLMTVGGVYDHQRSVTSDKRVFILTRSVFAGQQRYGANTWSGDVVSSWDALRNQISAGLNLSLCGVPYWNSDIGGFFLWKFPKKLDDANYRDLYVRWIQFGIFCPMMRSHGADAPREIYQFGKKGEKVYDAIDKSINLRYMLLPYIYSTSWDVTANQSTMMRALVMDFVKDKQVLDINNQYMFGKSLLVNPVTKPMYSKIIIHGKDTSKVEDFSKIKSAEVYLPNGTDWYDFWTGKKYSGGQTLNKETPIDIIPLYVKAGSILPIGPKVQYSTEKKWDNLEIRVYPGADGKFTLYEDENDNYNYEKGIYSTITFTWDNAKKTLTINNRKGSFPGMIAERKFNIVIVAPGAGDGMKKVKKYAKVITYSGNKVVVKA
jgi:alpha-D-xyloside xylohydrolase